ncbi:unnamed protein product, partial [Effrenium voratum]
GLLFPSPPPCPDEEVSRLSADFQQALPQELTISCRGQLLRDRDTFFWSLFTDHFGSNPNTPYMWMALPAFGFLLPSPMWHVQPQDAVVLLARRPPEVEYFSFTSFALWVPRRRRDRETRGVRGVASLGGVCLAFFFFRNKTP